MRKFFSNIKDRFYYGVESIKNRYPCKILSVSGLANFNIPSQITYQAVTKTNIRECNLNELMDDRLLIEKFHPTDAIKLGFLAAGDILLHKDMDIDTARELYCSITGSMFNEQIRRRKDDC